MSSTPKILSQSGDPELAARQWDAFFSRGGLSLPPKSPLLYLFGNSRSLVHHLLKDPSLARHLSEDCDWRQPKGKNQILREIKSLIKKASSPHLQPVMHLLRYYKRRESIRIAARDLSGLADFEETGQELTALAEGLIECATRTALQFTTRKKSLPPLTVLGLGKLGGADLNFSSDVDLLYLYEAPEGEPLRRQKTLFETFTRASETLTQILQNPTEEGIVYRVDLSLRPEGKSGPLVNSLDAFETYHEVSAAPWERAAMIKASPVAGDPQLGKEILHRLQPFIYRKALDLSVVAELKQMKKKINDELKKSRNAGFHVKLGVGGIREIEFFVTSFQLIYGGRFPPLRGRNTLGILNALKELKRVPLEDIKNLREAYIFLRKIENRLQMMEERQTHTLPTDPAELLALARRLGFESREPFLEKLGETTRFVSSCFENLLI